jgi:hypothetical protein
MKSRHSYAADFLSWYEMKRGLFSCRGYMSNPSL